MSGWIKLHRSTLDWEWWDDHNTTRVFTYLLLSANHKDKKWRGIDIKSGDQITSYEAISNATGLTYSQVRLSIDKLKRSREITANSTGFGKGYGLRIALVSWGKHQDHNTGQQQATTQSDDTTMTSNKNEKNERSIKNTKRNADKPDDISDQVWGDFITQRKAPFTDTALKGVIREAGKANINLERALSISCERGWQGFKAEWIIDKTTGVKSYGRGTPSLSETVAAAADNISKYCRD